MVLNTLNIINNASFSVLIIIRTRESDFAPGPRVRRWVVFLILILGKQEADLSSLRKTHHIRCYCIGFLPLTVILEGAAAEGLGVEEHGEDDDHDDEEEEREHHDRDVRHDLDAAVAHLHDRRVVGVVMAVAAVAAATASRGVAYRLLDVQRVLQGGRKGFAVLACFGLFTL